MKVTFLYHSAFCVESESADLMFDIYKGAEAPGEGDKPLLVFGSHWHGDHFSEKFFELSKKRRNIRYVLSSDVSKSRVPEEWRERTVFVRSREKREILPGITVETLASNDSGVAFLVTVDGRTIYHAGDLNDWHWIGEPERDNEVMTRKYRWEIDRIGERTLDVAFVVLDGRQEAAYDRGMNYLLEHVKVKDLFPMHCWEDYSWIKKYTDEQKELVQKTCFHEISGEGESFVLSGSERDEKEERSC